MLKKGKFEWVVDSNLNDNYVEVEKLIQAKDVRSGENAQRQPLGRETE